MQLFTMDKDFKKQYVIDEYESLVWTERFLGDSEVEMVVPLNKEMLFKLPEGTFLGIEESEEVMIIETVDLKPDSTIVINGISLMSWMNNRFVRATKYGNDQSYTLSGLRPGEALFALMLGFISEDSPYLDGTIDIGIENPERLIIPEVRLDLGDIYTGGDPLDYEVPYGPLYDAMRSIAATYNFGIQILRLRNPESPKPFRFRAYVGRDRTYHAGYLQNPVRFSRRLDSLANVEELHSIAAYKNLIFGYATQVPNLQKAGEASVQDSTGAEPTGFNLRAAIDFVGEIADETFDGSPVQTSALVKRLAAMAAIELGNNSHIHAVTGDVIDTVEHEFGDDYYLGDIVELEGYTGRISPARVVEFIRIQDKSGEKKYPTLSLLTENEINVPVEATTTQFQTLSYSPKVDVLIGQDASGSMEHSTWDDTFAAYITGSGALVDQLVAAGVDLNVAVAQYKDYCRESVANGGPGPPYADCGCSDHVFNPGSENTRYADDYPEYALRQAMTATKSLITAGIISGEIAGPAGGGGDSAEGLNYFLNKSHTDGAIGWRSGAKRVVLNHGDAEPHGAGTEGVSGCTDTSVDPHSLSILTELATMITDKVQLIMSLFREGNATTSATFAGYQGIAAAGYHGTAVHLATTSGGTTTFPSITSNFLSAPILADLAVADLHLEFDSASPSPADESWVTLPDPITDYVGYGFKSLGNVTVTAPLFTPTGFYTFNFNVVADGVVIGIKTVSLNVA